MSMFLFPFEKIPAQSRIILYGAGNVGAVFYQQLAVTGYAKLKLWVDRKFNAYSSVKAPFGKIEDIRNESYDYVIIAVESRKVAEEIKADLLRTGVLIEKIIWREQCAFDTEPVFHMFEPAMLLQQGGFYLELYRCFMKFLPGEYGYGRPYQSYPELGIHGIRSVQERIARYGLKEYLGEGRDKKVLDIGCNCGFFDMQIAGMAAAVTGIDVNQTCIEIAKKVQKHLKIVNCTFQKEDFKIWKPEETWDVVFSFAVHGHIGMPLKKYAKRLADLIKPQGILILESHLPHPKSYMDYPFDFMEEWLLAAGEAGFSLVRKGSGEKRLFFVHTLDV